jgi:hypothetical protein
MIIMPRQEVKPLDRTCPKCKKANLVEITTIYEEPFPEDKDGDLLRVAHVCRTGCGYHGVIRDDLYKRTFGGRADTTAYAHGLTAAVACG